MTATAQTRTDTRSSRSFALAPATRARLIAGVGAVAIVSLVALFGYVRFARLGFNPTDEGFVLGYARRLLDGRVPHRDFVALRPVGSSILHAPVVLLGRAHALLLDRVVTLVELAAAVHFVIEASARALGVKPSWIERASLVAIGFALDLHTAPLFGWHTYDGVLLSTAGLALVTRSSERAKLGGLLLLGFSYLCKQNFALLPPLALISFGLARRPRAWLAIAAPGLAYLAWMLATGGLGAFRTQMSAQTELWITGARPYFDRGAGGVAFGWVVAAVARPSKTVRPGAALTAAALALAATLFAGQVMERGENYFEVGFTLFGLALGASLSLLRDDAGEAARVGLFVSAIAWTASISRGYNTPAMAAGLCAVFLLLVARAALRPHLGALGAIGVAAVLLASTYLLLGGLDEIRHKTIYREAAASELRYDVGAALYGGAGLRTNARTFEMLADLDRAIAQTHHAEYAIVPDLGAYWIEAPQRNPLSLDWAFYGEMPNPGIERVVLHDLDALRARGGVVIVQKVLADSLARGFLPLRDDYSVAVAHVHRSFRKIGETAHYAIYQ